MSDEGQNLNETIAQYCLHVLALPELRRCSLVQFQFFLAIVAILGPRYCLKALHSDVATANALTKTSFANAHE
jgi:hypothetical protein